MGSGGPRDRARASRGKRSAALILSAALTLWPARAHAENRYDVILWILLGGAVAAGSLTVGTIHSLDHLTTDDPPAKGIMGFQLATAGAVGALAHGVLIAQSTTKGKSEAAARDFFLVVAGWADALTGFAIASFAGNRGQDRVLGASLGMTAAATNHAILRLVGGESSPGSAGIEALLASAGVADGLALGLGSGAHGGTRAAYLGFAGFSALAVAHGVIDGLTMPVDPGPGAKNALVLRLVPTAVRTDTGLAPAAALVGSF